MTIFSALQATVLEEVRTQHATSFPLLSFQKGIFLFSKAYLSYRSFRLISFIQSFDPPSKNVILMQSAALELCAASIPCGTSLLQIALAAKCADDLLREYRQLHHCYKKLKQTISWQYPSYEPITKKELSSFSSSQLLYRKSLQRIVEQIKKILRATADVFWQGFELSLHLYKIYSLFNGDSHAQYEGCVELIAAWTRYRQNSQNPSISLNEELQKRSELMDRILNCLKSETKTNELVKKIENSINNIANILSLFQENHKQAEKEVLNPVYIPGKITPLHIRFDFGLKSQASSRFPYPSWRGQRISKNLQNPSQASICRFPLSSSLPFPKPFNSNSPPSPLLAVT